MRNRHILIATPNKNAISVIRDCLHSEYAIEIAHDREGCLAKFIEKRHEFVFIDIALLDIPDKSKQIKDYKEALKLFWNVFPTVQIIAMSSSDETRQVVATVKAGASDYLTYPINPEEVQFVTENSIESFRVQSELDYFRDKFWDLDALDIAQTISPKMKKVFDQVKSVASTKTTVLITGETGTGKGVFAKTIHHHSKRKNNLFINVHCGAIPDSLIESELFGHEKGAFTGATSRKLGRFEIAENGTILLDEIGTLTPSAQIKLLQILQEKTFSRVGSETVIKSDVRIIAATNEDLPSLIDAGRFRKDLYYRINVFPIHIPPLRERVEDIPFLVQKFLAELNKYHLKNINAIHQDVIDALRKYDWPGNIRELENIIERAYIIEQSSLLTPESFPIELFENDIDKAHVLLNFSSSLAKVREDAIHDIEKKYLEGQLIAHQGRVNATAAASGVGVRQLHKLLTKHKINKSDYKPLPKTGK